jgi:hypothetical protein
MEINPDNPVTQAVRDQWHKLLGLVIWKYGGKELPEVPMITGADVEAFAKAFEGRGMPTILAHDRADGLRLRLIDEEEGRRIAHEIRATN